MFLDYFWNNNSPFPHEGFNVRNEMNTLTPNSAMKFILILGVLKPAEWAADGVVVFRLPQGTFKCQGGSARRIADKLQKLKNDYFSSITFSTVFKICLHGGRFDSPVGPHKIF